MRIFYLLRSRILSLGNSIRKDIWKPILVSLMGILFWFVLLFLSIKLFFYFKKAELIGDFLLYRFLSMILLVFFSVLTLSNIIASLSNLLLSKDLEICHSSPCSIEEIFISRIIITIFDSSWMLVIFGSPIIMAYAWIYHPGLRFYIFINGRVTAKPISSLDFSSPFSLFIANILPDIEEIIIESL